MWVLCASVLTQVGIMNGSRSKKIHFLVNLIFKRGNYAVGGGSRFHNASLAVYWFWLLPHCNFDTNLGPCLKVHVCLVELAVLFEGLHRDAEAVDVVHLFKFPVGLCISRPFQASFLCTSKEENIIISNS